MDSRRRGVPSVEGPRIARVILTPMRRPQPPYYARPETTSGHLMGTAAFRPAQGPVRRIIVRRPDPYNPYNIGVPPSTNFRVADTERFPRTYNGSYMPYTNDVVNRITEVPRIKPPDVIDVGLLAQHAERAITRCGITTNTQIWFEAIMMTLGENMSVMDASEQIGVNRAVLLRLMNIVRCAMGFSPLEGTILKQFSSESAVENASVNNERPPVKRVVRVVRRLEAPPHPHPPTPPELHESSAKSAERSLPEIPENPMEHAVDELTAPYAASTGKDLLKESLHLIKSLTVDEDEKLDMIDAKKQMKNCEQSLALDYASIASMRSVLREHARVHFKGNYDDLESYFKDLLIRHKQDANSSNIRALASFVANKNANFYKVVSKEGINKQLMRTMLRMALFEKRLESIQLSNTVEELLVPVNVTDINIVLNLIERKKDRACLKALYRFVSPLAEEDAMMRVAIERQIMDGFDVAAGVPNHIYDFWSSRMGRMLTCLLKEYPICIGKWTSLAESQNAREEEKSIPKKRESLRIKAQKCNVPDSLYLDKIFNRDLKRSFITFLKKLQMSGLPLSENTVMSIGRKVLKCFEEKRFIIRESWIDWIHLVLEEESSTLFDYLDRDE